MSEATPNALDQAESNEATRARLSLNPEAIARIEANARDRAKTAFDATTRVDAPLVALVQVSQFADDSIRSASEALAQRGLRVACKRGCWYCCASVVAATIPEILRIAERIRSNWTEGEVRRLRERIRAFNEALQPYRDGLEPHMPRRKCPLLVESACSVWPDRPLACMGFNSMDVRPCRQAADDPASEPLIPHLLPQSQIAMHSRNALIQVLEEHGLEPELCDLALGLEVALDNPDASNQYLAGEPVFDGAMARSKLK